jgi:hypothetical protein
MFQGLAQLAGLATSALAINKAESCLLPRWITRDNGRFTQAQIPNSGPRRPDGPTVEPQTGPGTVRTLTR